MSTFPAQLRTEEHLINVLVKLDDATVSIESGGETLGRWARGDCRFERHAPTAYRFFADGESVNIRVTDDAGFRQAIDLIRTERVQLIPPSLLIGGLAAIAAAIAGIAVFGFGGGAAAAEQVTPTTAPAPPKVETVTTSIPVEEPTRSATPTGGVVLVQRWNDVAAGTQLTLGGPGLTVIDARLTIEVDDDRIMVTAVPDGDAVASNRLVAALGLAVAAVDPALAPSQRAEILASLGLDIAGANHDALDTALQRGSAEYRLEFEPGERLMFSAGLEW